jgi:signal transduction histidine kinase
VPVDIDVDPLRLKAALRDFVALSAIPAVSVGREPEAVAAGLADSLVEVLHLDFAFVRMSDPDGVAAIEVTRGSARTNFHESLESHVNPISSGASHEVVLDVGDGSRPCHGIAISIGVNGKGGLVVVESKRSDFPSAIDRVLLSLAANHAAIAFENARLIHERDQAEEGLRKARDELEATVVERTAELNAANEELNALRRVATLVAQEASQSDVFSAIAQEIALLLGFREIRLVRYDDDSAVVVAAWGSAEDVFPVGAAVQLTDDSAASRVFRTGQPVRIDDYASLEGQAADTARSTGVRSVVAWPISLGGRLWGALTAGVIDEELPPPETESHLGQFTELMATAIANAGARGDVDRLAEEQAALRRVAVLVAQQPSPSEVFTAVTQAVGLLLRADLAVLHVFPGDGTATTIASWSGDGPMLPIGTRFPLDGENLAGRIFESGAPARMHSYDEAWEHEATDLARSLRVRSAVGAPILVEGKLWGALMAATRGIEPWAENAETRIAAFTELVATAIANAESRGALAELADEQAALRRVATLVARGAPPMDLFGAVAEEVGRLHSVDHAYVTRFESEETVTVMARWTETDEALPVELPRRFAAGPMSAAVRETRGPVRLHRYSDPAAGAIDAGVRSSVAAPITVEGNLWGFISAVSTNPEQPPAPGTETRLSNFTDLVATAIANAEGRSELAASRRRIVAASDDARRRIERDLHDGVQQQLVWLQFELRALADALTPEDERHPRVERITTGVNEIFDGLVELSRGIHPAILSQGGLGPALKALARRSTVPAELECQVEQRLPEEVEVAAYYVVSEALTNAAKHAQASVVHVLAGVADGEVRLAIRDDGRGGATLGRGSGLVGLQDRVEALGGTITIDSSAGNGTSVVATLPVATEAAEKIGNLLGPSQELESPTSPA